MGRERPDIARQTSRSPVAGVADRADGLENPAAEVRAAIARVADRNGGVENLIAALERRAPGSRTARTARATLRIGLRTARVGFATPSLRSETSSLGFKTSSLRF